jgi:hypothetical protein
VAKKLRIKLHRECGPFYELIDSGATVNLIDEKLANKLILEINEEKIKVVGIGEKESVGNARLKLILNNEERQEIMVHVMRGLQEELII